MFFGGSTKAQTEFETQAETICKDGDTGYCFLQPLPGFETRFDGEDTSFGSYFNGVLGIIIGIAGALAVVMIVVGGIQYMGSEVVTKKSDGRNMIENALLGLGVLLGAYVLLNTLDPDLVDFKLSLNKVEIEIAGDDNASFTLAFDDIAIPTDIYCPEGGGSSYIKSIADSFYGNVTYDQTQRTQPGPAGTIYLDCSSYANMVRQCAGLTPIPTGNGRTATMFTEDYSSEIFSITSTMVNGITLQPGDLLGWKAEECDLAEGGHVVVYTGSGLIADVHGPTGSIGNATTINRPLDSYKYKNCLKHIIPVS